MARQPESRRQQKIRKSVEREFGGFWFKVHGGPFQQAGIPDLLGCICGRYIGIEVKEEGKFASNLQKESMKEIRRNGGIAFVARSGEEAIRKIRKKL